MLMMARRHVLAAALLIGLTEANAQGAVVLRQEGAAGMQVYGEHPLQDTPNVTVAPAPEIGAGAGVSATAPSMQSTDAVRRQEEFDAMSRSNEAAAAAAASAQPAQAPPATGPSATDVMLMINSGIGAVNAARTAQPGTSYLPTPAPAAGPAPAQRPMVVPLPQVKPQQVCIGKACSN